MRIGFIGAGSMGQCAHLRNYASLRECEVVALAELRPKTAAAVARHYGIPRVYKDHTELLANAEVDALVCIQPFTRHGVLLPELARAGKPLFIEKPLTSNVACADTILNALREHNTWVMLGYHKRSDPAVIYAKAEIDRLKESRELGALTYVRISMSRGEWIAGGMFDLINEGEPKLNLDVEPRPADMDEATFKQWWAFINYFIHQVNLLRHFLGEPYQVTHADPSGALFVGRSASGVPCVIEMGPYKTTVDWQESILATFEHGYVKVELPAPLAINRSGRVELFRDPGKGATPETSVPQMPYVHAMRQQAINFIRAVRGESPPLCGAEEGVEDLKVARDYVRLITGK
ncbi:MAG: Gfo/Idh/MocA family oxidoreductase [Candidatus Sumerlaeota bacterium]|nr:Gfo/Idh/MocA family oxidoreductase [Candidatus Sumerlaeota bacterium]